MKQKIFTQKFKLLLIFAFATMVGQNAMATAIVAYPLTANASDDGFSETGQTGTLSTSPGLLALTFSGFNGASATNWNSTTGGMQYWQISPFSTIDLHTIQVSAFMKSDATGPKNFVLQYKKGVAGTWTNTQTIALDGTSTNYTVTLPVECINQPAIYVRWITTDYKDLSGNDIAAGAKSYIKSINIIGSVPIVPNSQASNLTFVSITPTTITMDCSSGNGDNRIVVINTTNSFTNPVDNQIYTSNSTYIGSGQQVIYNGNLTKMTVSVPSSRNTYWFRVYDYNYNGGMTRYRLVANPTNPKECSLETIDTDPATLVRLTTATIGATISEPQKFEIGERGFVWKTTPGVGETDNKTAEGGTTIGSFTKAFTNVARGSRIYYRGYVTNLSGTIYSNELYFDNTPIFSGIGDWEDNTKWNVLQVPGSTGDGGFGSIADSPFIEGTCTLNVSNSVTNLTINNSGNKLSINPATILTVAGTLTNNVGTSGLIVEANSTDPNASLIFTNKALNQNVPASVQMYSIASTLGGNHWQYFGVPVQSQTVGITFGGSERVRRFNEANFDPSGNDYGLWYPYPASTMAAGETLSPVVGYEVVQASAKTYTFKGNLNATDFNHPLAYTTVPQLADYAGQNIIANPFAAAINISGLGFGSAEATAYLYNTGSREEWTNNNGETTAGINPGTYIAVPSALAGSLGIPSQIPSMQGFLVKTLVPTSISIPYSSIVTNTAPQRAPVLDQKVATMIDVIGSKSSDRMWIFSEPTCTRNYDNGFDGRKILGYNTQLFAMEGSEDYQIDAVNDINNTYLGFQSGSETNLKLKFTHQNLEDKYSRVYLTDLVENKTIDITASGTEYVFTAVPSTTPSQRFKITTSTTDNITPDAGEQIKIFGSQGNAVIQNLSNAQGNAFIYTMGGQFVHNVRFSANGVTTISNLKAGAYIVKAKTTAANEVNSYLIIR